MKIKETLNLEINFGFTKYFLFYPLFLKDLSTNRIIVKHINLVKSLKNSFLNNISKILFS